ncbi:MAG: DUF493 family protein [Bacteroidetes bacterium]|nr:DUF493 family protein [Bacteroidota bacterium]HET6243333.1 DUF493 domain-containing protein [Bacteroidia bacterium]
MNTNQNFSDSLNKLEWPSIYPFKFIVPIAQLDEVLIHFQLQETTIRLSKNGNYASVSATPFLLNPEKVFEVYNQVSQIKGLISL